MKSKKLFAVMTLVMFMMTLLPLAAFGTSVTAFSVANVTAGTKNVVVTGTTNAAIGAGGSITLTLPTGFTATPQTTALALNGVGSTITAGAGLVAATDTYTATANTITITSVAGIGAGAAYGFTVACATAPTTAGTYAASLVTSGDVDAAAANITVVADDASLAASKISVNSTSKSADGSSAVTATVVLRDRFNNLTTSLGAGNSLYVWGERTAKVASDAEILTGPFKADGTTAILIGSAATNYKEITAVEMTAATSNTAKVKFASNVAGDVNIKAAIHGAGVVITTVAPADGNKIGSAPTKFTPLGVGSITPTVPAGPFAADGTEYEITFTVKDSAGNPLAGEVVQFSVNKSGAMLSKTEATTDILGEVKVKVSANKADTYIVTALDGSITNNSGNMIFGASGTAFDIVAPAAIADKVAVNTAPNFDFKVYDIYGNQFQQAGLTALLAGGSAPTASFITKPAGASVSDSDLKFEARTNNTLRVKFDKKPDKLGTYTIKVKLANGKSATSTFDVATQGAIVRMTLSYSEDLLAWGSTSGTPSVKYYDANDVYYSAVSGLPGITISVNNANLASVSGNTIKAALGSASNYQTGEVVITAVDVNRNLVATDTMSIGSTVATLSAEDVAGEVGQTATITLQIKDQDGKNGALDSTGGAVSVDVYAVSKPAGATVSYDLPAQVDYQKSLTRTGKVDLKVGSDKAGEVVYTVIVTQGTVTVSKTVKATFGATTAAIGAKSVTLFIGASGYVQDGVAKVTDLAPFIKDSRTFVAVRPIADAFGAEIGWNEATQTVTLTREDMTLTIVIGSNVITKVADGVTTTSEADVAAFIQDGRTVLPFRAIGEAFGATVEYDATTQAVSFTQAK